MEKTVDNNELREALAAYAHEAWCGWMRYVWSKSEQWPMAAGGVGRLLPAWAVERWERQMWTDYASLPEDEKESDRQEADKMLAILAAFHDMHASDLFEGVLDAFESAIVAEQEMADETPCDAGHWDGGSPLTCPHCCALRSAQSLTALRDAFAAWLASQAAPAQPAADEPWQRLDDLPPGTVFETEDGTRAVKTEYRRFGRGEWRCILLGTGEYAAFAQGDDTRVRPINL